jgi:hypothetical protein
MEHDERVAAYLREAEDLAVKIAHDQISIDEYAETIEALKANVPKERVIEVEVVFQLAAFKMEQENVQTSQEVRQCYRIAARMARGGATSLGKYR